MQRRKRIYLIILATFLAGFLLLTAFVHNYPLSDFDIAFTRQIQLHHSPFIDACMRVVSFPGQPPYSFLLVPLTALVFLFTQSKREALYIFLTSFSGLIGWILKIIVNRPRPGADIVTVMVKVHNQSFPSGHVLFYVTFFGMLLVIMVTRRHYQNVWRWSISILSALMIFLVPLSRIYLGAHWFTDVNAGFIAGLFCLSVLAYFYLFKNPQDTSTLPGASIKKAPGK